MNDSPEVAAAGPAARATPDAAGKAASAGGTVPVGSGLAASGPPLWRRVWPLLLAIGLVLAIGASWFANERLDRTERDFARRLQAIELAAQQREEQSRLAADTLRETQSKLALVEARLADSLGQQIQLRQLYDEMARNRGDLLLADVENSIMIAAQQLQLGGNVQSALLALQDADQVLGRSNQPSLIGLRRTIARDIDRLKALPLADFTAAVARLDAAISAIDQMPALADLGPASQQAGAGAGAAEPSPEPATEPATGLMGLSERFARTGLQGWDAFVAELRSLLRVQRVDQPDALLLTPDQRYFARENLRLHLLHARLNLLSRNEMLFRADLTRSLQAIDRWFDPQHRAVSGTVASLQQLRSTALVTDLPTLAESLAAVRAARAASDAR